MTRISTSELYNNRNIIKQICDLQDDLAGATISDIAFNRSGENVTLDINLESGEVKTATFVDRSITNVTASQVGAVVTLTFHFSDGTSYDITFTASGSGGATITAGQGILVTGTTLTGYTVAVDPSFVATKEQVYVLDGRVTAAEAQVNILTGEVTAAVTQINSNTARIIDAENDINIIQAKIGSSISPGTIIKRLDDLEDAEVVVDTSSYSTAAGHVPQSSLVNSTKMDAATNTGTVGMILTRTATGAQWEAPATGLVMDTAMSGSSTNPVQNKAIKEYVDEADADLDAAIEAVEQEIGPDTVSGTVRYDIKALQDRATTDEGLINIINNSAVHKTGNETISGEKTFTNKMTIDNANAEVKFSGSEASFVKVDDRFTDTVSTEIVSDNLACIHSTTGTYGLIRLIKPTTGKIRLACVLRNSDGTYKEIVLAEADN